MRGAPNNGLAVAISEMSLRISNRGRLAVRFNALMLPEGEVFEDHFMTSSAGQGERSDAKGNHLQRATAPVMLRDECRRVFLQRNRRA